MQHLLYQRTPQDATKALYYPLVENNLTTYINEKEKGNYIYAVK